MKYQRLLLMAAVVSYLSATLMFTTEAFVPTAGLGADGGGILLLILLLFPLLRSRANTDTTVVGVESDHDFYNRVICATGTPAPDADCLACFDHVTQTTCSADPDCVWNLANNICVAN